MKRIALDFDWLLNKVWESFINPHKVSSHTRCRE